MVRVDLQSLLTFRFCLLYFSLTGETHGSASKPGLYIDIKIFLLLGKQTKVCTTETLLSSSTFRNKEARKNGVGVSASTLTVVMRVQCYLSLPSFPLFFSPCLFLPSLSLSVSISLSLLSFPSSLLRFPASSLPSLSL